LFIIAYLILLITFKRRYFTMAPTFAGLYAILGLDARSKPGPNEIKKAFHATALRLHPDKNPYDSRATAKFQNAVKAYEKLLSTCVNIEEEPEPKVTRSEEPEEEEEEEEHDVPRAMPKRMRNAFKKRTNKEANVKHQVEAGINNAQKRREEALETKELRDLQARIDSDLKKVLEESLGQEGRALSHPSDIHRRALLLTRKELNKQNRKQRKPTLNVKDPELEDVGVTKADAQEYATKLRAQEQKDEEFRLFELPLNYVHPFHEETEEEMRKNRRPSFFEREEEVNEKSKALADMLCEFWDDRVGEHGSACNEINFKKHSRISRNRDQPELHTKLPVILTETSLRPLLLYAREKPSNQWRKTRRRSRITVLLVGLPKSLCLPTITNLWMIMFSQVPAGEGGTRNRRTRRTKRKLAKRIPRK
jgi:hypothetical protein